MGRCTGKFQDDLTSNRSKGSMHSTNRIFRPSYKNERIFSKSVFRGNEHEFSNSDSDSNENEKITYKPTSGGALDANSMIEPNENFDTKSFISKNTHATHLNIAQYKKKISNQFIRNIEPK